MATVTAVICRLCRRGGVGCLALCVMVVLAGCGEFGSVSIQRLPATVLPSSGEAIVVLSVPGAS